MSKHKILAFRFADSPSSPQINCDFFLSLAGSDLYDLSSARLRSANRDLQEERRPSDGRI